MTTAGSPRGKRLWLRAGKAVLAALIAVQLWLAPITPITPRSERKASEH